MIRNVRTNIPNDEKAKEFLTSLHNLFGPNVEAFPPATKSQYNCVNEIYEEQTDNNVKEQLDERYDGMNPITAAYFKDLRDGDIEDDCDGKGSDDENDNDPNIQ